MPTLNIFRATAGAACFLGLASPMAGQAGKPTMGMIVRAPKATLPVVPRAPTPAPTPPRPGLTSNQYLATRAQVAASLGVAELSLPKQTSPKTNLSVIGNVVTIDPNGPPIVDFGWSAETVALNKHRELGHLRTHSPGGATLPGYFSTVSYSAYNIPNGSYLIMPRFGSTAWKYIIHDGLFNTPVAQLPGNFMIAYKKERSGSLTFSMYIPLDVNENYIYGVDIMRVQ
jgi:hypothetical protein